MALTPCTDATAADWITGSDLPWDRLVGFGPAGFGAYARMRFLVDPQHPGQSENDAPEPEDWRERQRPVLLEVLAGYTTTPEDCYVCVWDGWGHAEPPVDDGATYHHGPVPDDDARPGLAPGPAAARPATRAARVEVPNRAYWLFRGPLADAGPGDDPFRIEDAVPAFLWPADRAWCLADEVDTHWAGIGGPPELVDRLVGDPRLDVVRVDPAEEQPWYR